MKKYLDIILINLLTLLCGIILYTFTLVEVEVFGAIIATGISISFGIRQYKVENDKIFKELFSSFNRKYNEKFNEALNNIYRGSDNEKHILSEKDKLVIADYLNFCAEEYLWFTKDRIPDCVWNSWKDGMLFFLKLEPIKEILKKEKEQSSSYYGFFKNIIEKEVLNKEKI